MERTGWRRFRILRYSCGDQLVPSNGPLRSNGCLLPKHNQWRVCSPGHILHDSRHEHCRLPRHPPRRCNHDPFPRPQARQLAVVRRGVHAFFVSVVTHRSPIHHPRPICFSRPPGRTADRIGGPRCCATHRLLRHHLLPDSLAIAPHRLHLLALGDTELYSR